MEEGTGRHWWPGAHLQSPPPEGLSWALAGSSATPHPLQCPQKPNPGLGLGEELSCPRPSAPDPPLRPRPAPALAEGTLPGELGGFPAPCSPGGPSHRPSSAPERGRRTLTEDSSPASLASHSPDHPNRPTARPGDGMGAAEDLPAPHSQARVPGQVVGQHTPGRSLGNQDSNWGGRGGAQPAGSPQPRPDTRALLPHQVSRAP